MSIWIILLIWGFAGLIGYFGAKASRAPKNYETEDRAEPDDKNPERHWTEYVTDDDDDTEDRDDDWEWDREDDWGDSWDQEDGEDGEDEIEE